MSNAVLYLVIGSFIAGLLVVSWLAKRREDSAQDSAEGYLVGGRSIGTGVLLLSMGATYFSTWTLLGSFGSYYRSGIWFAGFTVWTIFHAIFIWLFGMRIWLAGKRFGFLTPGQMIGHYFDSKRLRVLVAIVGVMALVPVMLIQVTGAALALEALTNGAYPYWLGVLTTSVLVGAIVMWAGFKGTAWGDSFMGIFFATIMIGSAVFAVRYAGGFDMFRTVSDLRPDMLVNKGDPVAMLELWLGLGFGAWVLPHMWQKYYSAASPEVLGKVMVATPFWNSWMMAVIPLLISVAVVVPGLTPNLTIQNSDTILPQLFAAHAPLLGAFVVAGILAAGISTVNSQLLSAASIVAFDIYGTLRNRELSSADVTLITRIVVAVLTVLLFVLAMMPGGGGFLVPVAALGFGFGLQLVPSALGALYFERITEKGAFLGLLLGTLTMAADALLSLPLPVGPAIAGLGVNVVVTLLVSLVSPRVSDQAINGFHTMFRSYLTRNV